MLDTAPYPATPLWRAAQVFRLQGFARRQAWVVAAIVVVGRAGDVYRHGCSFFGYGARVDRAQRSLPIGGALALVAAAMAKLFLFDLGTLDAIFRVAVFIVVGLILLGTGAG